MSKKRIVTKKNDDVKEKKMGKFATILAIVTLVMPLLSIIPNNLIQQFYDLKLKKTHVFLEAQLDVYAQGYINDEIVPVFAGNRDRLPEYAPTVKCTLTNKNEETICVENIAVEVASYTPLDGLEMENPVGGADVRQIYWWTCEITDEVGNYYAKLEDESRQDEEYSVIEYNDIEKNGVMIYPDTPGMYEIKIVVEYLFRNKTQTKKSESMKFIYDPNDELTYVVPGINH